MLDVNLYGRFCEELLQSQQDRARYGIASGDPQRITCVWLATPEWSELARVAHCEAFAAGVAEMRSLRVSS
jgi:hypothetical protein